MEHLAKHRQSSVDGRTRRRLREIEIMTEALTKNLSSINSNFLTSTTTADQLLVIKNGEINVVMNDENADNVEGILAANFTEMNRQLNSGEMTASTTDKTAPLTFSTGSPTDLIDAQNEQQNLTETTMLPFDSETTIGGDEVEPITFDERIMDENEEEEGGKGFNLS